MRVLVVDDDQYILDLLTYLLTREGHSVVTARDGQQALAYWRVEKPDLVISEVDLPKLGGYELCEIVKGSGSGLFILLSERTSEKDILKGFAAGADDYIAKPFSPRILIARIGAVTRRIAAPAEGVFREKLEIGELALDASRLEVTGPRGTVRLSPTEFEILHALASNKGVVVSEERLGELVWGPEGRGKGGLVKSHIHQIRQRIEPDPNSPRYLLTVPGVGYTMTPLRPFSKEPSDRARERGLSVLRSSDSGSS
jgi:DNA-binding response OmpR family regulator